MDIYAGGPSQTCISFSHPYLPQHTVFILGCPILRAGDDYRYPDTADWRILLGEEARLRALDGHWVIVIAGPDSVTAFNDPLCTRSLYIYQDAQRIFFTSHLEYLRAEANPQIDLKRLGAYWFSLFPPGGGGQRLLPTYGCWYQNVEMLGTGGKAVLSPQSVEITQRDWYPDADSGDLLTRIRNMMLLPFRAGKRVVLGLSGGMDIRALLAAGLAANVPVSAVHFGSADTVDCHIARSIATHYGIPFRVIRYEESGVSWEQAKAYLENRGLGHNPALCDFMGYYTMLADDFDVFISGNQGEFFRFRFLSSYRKCLGRKGPFGIREISSLAAAHPPRLFSPDAIPVMYKGFQAAVEQAASAMPDSREMQDLLWIHLFLLRYKPRTSDMPNQAWMDGYVMDHMPFLQSSVMSGHWHYGVARQLSEQVHRQLVRRYMPSLADFPLALASISAPWWMPPLAMKTKLWLAQRGKSSPVQSRGLRFLLDNRARVLELANDGSCTADPYLDQRAVADSVRAFYVGDTSRAPELLSLLSYLLGK